MANNKKPTNEKIIEALENSGGNASAAARSLGVPERTMRRWVADNNLNKVDTKKRKVNSQEAVDGSLSPEALHLSPEELMKKYKLGDDYVPVKLDISERDAGTATSPKVNRSISLTVEKKIEMPRPAFEGKTISIKSPKRKASQKNTNSELVIILSDYHAPYVDMQLHQASLQLILDSAPNRIIVAGDLVDFPTTSRHTVTTKRCMASASECIQVGGQILADLKAAAPDDCLISFIPGNHDQWLTRYILDKASALYDLSAYNSDIPVWSFENLLRLNEIGIEIVGEPDTFPHSHIALTDHLIVHHGDTARKGSGASPLASMAGKDFAEIHGHTHRQSTIARTVHLADGSTRIYQGGEIGSMCKFEADGFPTYTRHPDWQAGFCSVSLALDDNGKKTGHYSMDLATWQNGRLMWRGKQWS